MIFKKIGIFLCLILSLVPFRNIIAQSSNVGIIPSNIWYSKDPFVEGDKIKVYTLVYNPDDKELSGTVIFFDNTIFLGKKDFKVSAKSVKDVFIDWTVSSGSHVIFAKIDSAKVLISKDTYKDVYLAENKTEESKRSVSKKITADLINEKVDSVANSVPVSDITRVVKENTPAFVTKTLDSTIGFLEDVRTNTDISLDNKKDSLKKEIDILNKKTSDVKESDVSLDTVKGKTLKEQVKETDNTNYILKPFKYTLLFFMIIFSFIFKHKILFYCLLIFVVFLILRFIWRKIF